MQCYGGDDVIAETKKVKKYQETSGRRIPTIGEGQMFLNGGLPLPPRTAFLLAIISLPPSELRQGDLSLSPFCSETLSQKQTKIYIWIMPNFSVGNTSTPCFQDNTYLLRELTKMNPQL